MVLFTFRKWKNICKKIANLHTAKSFSFCCLSDVDNRKKIICLKHDVETNVRKAFKIAKIENKYGIQSTFFVQHYLLDKKKNLDLLTKMKNMGHEISYHYDVLDRSGGDFQKASIIFENEFKQFKRYGFIKKTVCQHGNPLVTRIGYTSNRDFFRDKKIQEKYFPVCDVMVNFKEVFKINYLYFSDAGYCWKLIKDPINDDKNKTENLVVASFDGILNYLNVANIIIISSHPHRYCTTYIGSLLRILFFKFCKKIAVIFKKMPFFSKIVKKTFRIFKKI